MNGLATAGQGQFVHWLPGQVALIEPDVLLGKAAAEVLRGRYRVVVRTGADANAGGPFLGDHRFHAQACAQAKEVFAVFAGVEQRRQTGAAVGIYVVRAVVVELGEVDDFVAVVARVVPRLVSQANVTVEADARGPVRKGIRRGPVFLFGGGHDLGFDLIADLVAHCCRYVLHAHIARRGDRSGRDCGGRGSPFGLRRFVLRLGDQRVGLVLLENALLDQQADQIDRGVLRRRRRCHGLTDQGRNDHADRQGQSIHVGNHLHTTPFAEA